MTLENESVTAVYMASDAEAIVFAGGITFNDGTTMSTAAGAGADGPKGDKGDTDKGYWSTRSKRR